jgi:hypothetical protein
MTIKEIKRRNLLIFECVSGSRAYGTNLPTSDTDIKGVFVLPEADFYGLNYVEQVSNESNDEVYYEWKRFVELLYRNNPNLLEMLNSPTDCILYKHPVFEQVTSELFLSKLCKDTFAGYAMTQVRKARGLNKKILNPIEPERKDVLDFCYLATGQGSVPAREWLKAKGFVQENCGLVSMPHMKNVFALFYDYVAGQTAGAERLGFRGIYRKEESNEVALSSVPKEVQPEGYLFFNKEGYSTYCKDYKSYWDWVENRNEERYQNTLQHGKNYDAKNMMHTIRLLEMAEEIASQKKVIVRRPNREFLLQIRRGDFSYEELVQLAEEKIARIDEVFHQSDLPDQPDFTRVNQLLVNVRKQVYKGL